MKKFNRELNSHKYGIRVNGKTYTDEKDIDINWSIYETIPIADFKKYKVGVCWDFVNYQHSVFKTRGLHDTSYFYMGLLNDDPNDIVTHTFSIVDIDGKKYWVESSWYKHQGVHTVKSFKDVVKYLNEDYDIKEFEVYEYNPDGLDNNLTNSEYFKLVTKNEIWSS